MSAANPQTMAEDAKKEIDLRQAVKIAREFVREAFEGQTEDLRLEETEFSDFENHWLITLSFLRERSREEYGTNVFAAAVSSKARDYKIVDIDAHDGKVQSMKIRKL